jgi:hypothetical protein
VLSPTRPPSSPTPPSQARGWRGPLLPLAPPGRWGIIVGDVHHGRAVAHSRGKRWRYRRSRGCRDHGRCRCRRFLLRPCGHSRVVGWLTRCRSASSRPRRPRRTPPRRHGRVRPEGTVSVTLRTKKPETEHQPLKIKGAQGKCYLPQIGEAPFPLPRGFGRRRCGARRRRSSAHRRPRGARGLHHGARDLLK